MSLNPFSRKTKADLAREKLDEAGRAIELLSEPVSEHARKPLGIAVAVLGGAVFVYVLRRALGSSASDDLPQPGTVTPTAPSGPTDDRLNDPALKAKVESELFAADGVEVAKEKVSIGVADGVVTLRGQLDSVEQSTGLVANAEQIDGVRRVENLLTAS